ncbi:MAG: nuclear transport factor 2 family protein [Bryobacteraceae bacterium]
MEEEQIREALNAHWHASAVGDANAEHDIYDDDAICDYPQSGERIFGRTNLQAVRSHHPGKPSGFNVKRILGNGDLWITEYTIIYQGRPASTVSIMEFRNGPIRAASFRVFSWTSNQCPGRTSKLFYEKGSASALQTGRFISRETRIWNGSGQ